MSNTLREQIKETINIIKTKTDLVPSIAIILGTGLGSLTKEIEKDCEIPYTELPHFAESTVESHEGKLIFGTLNGKKVVAMQGRFHLYEGYTMKQITFPVRVMHALGAKTLLVSNACGGLNPLFKRGDIMLMTDHINLLGDNPLIGANDEEMGPRFPDMCEAYTKKLIELAEQKALELKIKVQKGVYVAVSGPNLETAAEYRMLRITGADVVGMSTIPEVIVAVHSGMQVLGFSIVTDMGLPDALEPVDIKEIIKISEETEPRLTKLMKSVVADL